MASSNTWHGSQGHVSSFHATYFLEKLTISYWAKSSFEGRERSQWCELSRKVLILTRSVLTVACLLLREKLKMVLSWSVATLTSWMCLKLPDNLNTQDSNAIYTKPDTRYSLKKGQYHGWESIGEKETRHVEAISVVLIWVRHPHTSFGSM